MLSDKGGEHTRLLVQLHLQPALGQLRRQRAHAAVDRAVPAAHHESAHARPKQLLALALERLQRAVYAGGLRCAAPN
eukprot:366071-Chlamydomonas_euryale.AAC.4